MDVGSTELDIPRGADDTDVSGLLAVLDVIELVGRKMSIAACWGIECLNFSWHDACMMVNCGDEIT